MSRNDWGVNYDQGLLLTSEVQRQLNVLLGMPLWSAGRAAEMLWLQLGAHVTAPTPRDLNRITGEYALHLQCPWRLSNSNGMIVGATDIYIPSDQFIDDEDFDWDVQGASVADVKLTDWISANSRNPLTVEEAIADHCGGFMLRLSNGDLFEAFTCTSSASHEDEQWRLLQPAKETKHFVVTNNGLIGE
ncbi:MAG: hypothetical protein IT366_23495 [Candidatus Hydrogenedentes bacterium]|nr:hypothetical protein [Candidatus Hydrogenedentota bacterium]